MMSTSTWDPNQYNRFATEREQPFWDLCALLEPVASARVADLGCGDGRLTATLHSRLGAAKTIGVDSSPKMLAAAESYATENIAFVAGDIASWDGRDFDVVFSNAALHWVPDHAQVLERWRDALTEGGQLAIQIPANSDHLSHRVQGTWPQSGWAPGRHQTRLPTTFFCLSSIQSCSMHWDSGANMCDSRYTVICCHRARTLWSGSRERH